jgi:hypothetical protein
MIPGTTLQVYYQRHQRIAGAVGQIGDLFLSFSAIPRGIFLHTHLLSVSRSHGLLLCFFVSIFLIQTGEELLESFLLLDGLFFIRCSSEGLIVL